MTKSKIQLFSAIVLIFLLAGAYIIHMTRENISADPEAPEDTTLTTGTKDIMSSSDVFELTEPKPAPDFALSSVEGKRVSLSQYKGNVVLISFWATW
ncbi:MAG TPA: redoxin domain-containing protein [Nitrospirae bacterium]|nr:redoxin domain-containing protein [Nitrospirota bacterium]